MVSGATKDVWKHLEAQRKTQHCQATQHLSELDYKTDQTFKDNFQVLNSFQSSAMNTFQTKEYWGLLLSLWLIPVRVDEAACYVWDHIAEKGTDAGVQCVCICWTVNAEMV